MMRSSRTKHARVAIVGFGTIGKRIADAVKSQPDMELSGIGLRSASPAAIVAHRHGYRLYCTHDANRADLKSVGLPIVGGLDDLLEACDVVIDCTPRNHAADRFSRYRDFGKAIILQGGERHGTTGFTFCTFVNFSDVSGYSAARIPSCNTTGLVRLLSALDRAWSVGSVKAVLARCASDPDKSRKGVVNGAILTPSPSHHGPDVQLLLPHIEILTQSITVPMTHGHVISLFVDLACAVGVDDVVNYLGVLPRITVITEETITGTHQLGKLAAELGRLRGDRPELLVWGNSISSVRRTLCLQVSVHMESIVIPESMDCVRGLLGMQESCAAVMWKTDTALGIAKDPENYRMFDR